MSYSVNPSAFKSIFAVPTDIVDKHIRLANEHQLKVLLWILRNSPDNPDIKLDIYEGGRQDLLNKLSENLL